MNYDYTVQSGDSPSKIASQLGVPFADLIAANPGKGTVVVSGIRTWSALVPGEIVRVPGPRISDVGMTAAKAFDVLNADASYCESVKRPGTPTNVAVHAFKQAWNAANPGKPLPVGTGNYEATVAAALTSVLRTDAPSACGGSRMMTFTRHPRTYTETSAGVISDDATGGLADIASDAVIAMDSDPNYCQSVRQPGSPVNVAVHKFKKAWNDANPGKPIPIGTGGYEVTVAAALASAMGGLVVPDACTGASSASVPKAHKHHKAGVGAYFNLGPHGSYGSHGEGKMEYRRPAASLARRPEPRFGHRPEPPHGYRPEPPYEHRRRPAPPVFVAPQLPYGFVAPPEPPAVDDWGDVPDATDAAPAAAPAAPAAAAPAATPDASATPAAAPPAPPAAPSGDAPPEHEKKEKGHEKKEEGLSTGMKIGIGAGAVAVVGGIVAVVTMKKKGAKPATKELREYRR
jgi:hypothetical protein